MNRNIRQIAKGGIASATLGALALAGASPAVARDRGGIDSGDVIAGALVIGGIAAIASVASKDRDGYGQRYEQRDAYGYHDSDYRTNRYGHGNSRAAIQRCVAAVERDARQAGYRNARVVDIHDVDRERRGWEVIGRLVVDGQRGYAYNDRNRYDDRRYDDRRYDYGHGYGDRGRSDSGSFKCEIERGRIVDLDYSGIRGLR